MELPIKLIVIIAVVAMVLVVLSTLFLQSSGQSLSKAEAERIFNTQCINYGQRGCQWSVTYEPSFADYLKACRVLHGDQREAYSCLYSLCDRCFETTDLKCSGLCNICNGHDYASVARGECCSAYASQCQGSSVNCGACPWT